MNITIATVETDAAESADFDQSVAMRLMAFNEAHGRAYDFAPLKLSAINSAGELLGGLVGVTGWDWLMIDRLIVDESKRGLGIGSQLMQTALQEAKARGCIGAMLDTFSFQARGFYQKIGFEVFATLQDMPKGFERYWMRRTI